MPEPACTRGSLRLRDRWYEQGFFAKETISDVIWRGAEVSPESFLVSEGRELQDRFTQSEMLGSSLRLAAALRSIGIKPGDRVAVQLPNGIESIQLTAAVWLAGAVLVPITAIYRNKEVSYIVNSTGAELLFCPGVYRGHDFRDTLDALLSATNLRHVVFLADGAPDRGMTFDSFSCLAEGADIERWHGSADSEAAIVYTSGTTSDPKGVVHTHNTLLAERRAAAIAAVGSEPGVQLNPWPYGHIASLLSMLSWWYSGVSTVLVDRWVPEYVAELIHRYRIQSASGVPFFLNSLLDAGERVGHDLSSLQKFGTGAANVPSSMIERCNDKGITTVRIYGMTEHPTVTSGSESDPLERRTQTDGRCLPGNNVRIVDDTGANVPQGCPGEIATLGPEMFVGYHEQVHNQGAFLEGGWFLTGDIGVLDESGYLTVFDRKKDIIIRGGENISSREVEEVLLTHPRVLECAAIAEPHPTLGETVCAVVVQATGSDVALSDVVDLFQQAGVARQKIPEKLIVVSDLPRNAAGKVQKNLLRKQLEPQKGSVRTSKQLPIR